MHDSLLRWALLVAPIQTEVWPGRPEDLVRGAPDRQADMKRPLGYVMDLGILYRRALYVSIVVKGRPWKTNGRQPEPRDALLAAMEGGLDRGAAMS